MKATAQAVLCLVLGSRHACELHIFNISTPCSTQSSQVMKRDILFTTLKPFANQNIFTDIIITQQLVARSVKFVLLISCSTIRLTAVLSCSSRISFGTSTDVMKRYHLMLSFDKISSLFNLLSYLGAHFYNSKSPRFSLLCDFSPSYMILKLILTFE